MCLFLNFLKGLELSKKTNSVPWKSIFRSMPFWAILVANFGNNWVFHLLLTELPIYMKTILGQNLSDNSLYSALPYACMWAFSFVVSYLVKKYYYKVSYGSRMNTIYNLKYYFFNLLLNSQN